MRALPRATPHDVRGNLFDFMFLFQSILATMSRGRKKKGNPIDGVLLLDKPGGMTSNRALQHCKHLIAAQKGGHTGSLDPLATGLLPLCFGQATKVSSFLLGSDKTYEVGVTLGQITDTGDADGEVIESRPVDVSEADVKQVLLSFIGEYDQVPPMYSALKVNGQPLYKLARQGIVIERKSRRVTAFDIRFSSLKAGVFCFEVDCSSGFYVRSLVEDIGEKLGCGAHVKTLRRTRIEQLYVEDAISLSDFEAMGETAIRIAKLVAADTMITRFSPIELDEAQTTELNFGRAVQLADLPLQHQSDDWLRLYGPQRRFLGLGKINAQGQLLPKRLFVQTNEMLT